MITNILFYILYVLVMAIVQLPLRFLYKLSDVLYVILYYVIRYRRKITAKNLRLAFPEKSSNELLIIERTFYRHLCDIFIETIKELHISNKELHERIDIRNTELIEQIAAEGHPIILFIGHYGNWEWVQEITSRYKQPTVSGEIYKPLRNLAMEKLTRTIRSHFKNTLLIPQKKAVRTILALKKQQPSFLIGFIADQRPTRDNLRHWTIFLNNDTAYVVGGEEIGNHIDARFCYMDIEMLSRGHYRMTFKLLTPVEGEEYPYTIAYYRELEQTILRAPAYWLWSHDRWKHPKKDI